MNKRIKLLISTIILSLSLNNAQAGIMDFVSAVATKQVKDPNKASQSVDNKEITALSLAGAVGVGLMAEAKNRAALDRFVNDRSLVKPYFKEHNDEIIPFSKYLVHTIAQPQPYEDYVKYKEFATYLGLIKLPPYAGDVKNGPVVHTQPQQDSPHNGVYQNPIANTQFSNIIYTPQGEKIDTGAEFPNQIIHSWEEYLLLKSNKNVRELERNMKAAGYGDKPFWYAPHHIVAWDDRRAAGSRALLDKELIGYNDAENGVYLPQIESARTVDKNGVKDIASRHTLIHTDLYYQEVEDRLRQFVGDPVGMRQELRNIANELKNNTFPY